MMLFGGVGDPCNSVGCSLGSIVQSTLGHLRTYPTQDAHDIRNGTPSPQRIGTLVRYGHVRETVRGKATSSQEEQECNG